MGGREEQSDLGRVLVPRQEDVKVVVCRRASSSAPAQTRSDVCEKQRESEERTIVQRVEYVAPEVLEDDVGSFVGYGQLASGAGFDGRDRVAG